MAKLDLISELRRRRFEHALIATYELQVAFFESYCLRQLKSFAHADNMVVFADAGTYAKLLAATGTERPKQAGRAYFLSGAHCCGAFHPKVYLFTGKKHGLLIIGSNNLTRVGFTDNAELAGCFRFEFGEDEAHARLFADVYAWFGRVGQTWGSPTIIDAVAAAGQDCPWLRKGAADTAKDPGARFLHNLDEPLWGQLHALAGAPLRGCKVLSPYFGLRPKLLDDLADDLAGAELEIVSERARTTMTPEWLEHPRMNDDEGTVTLTRYPVDDYKRKLHAKALALRTDKATLLAYGSANFTIPALMATPKQGNCECMLALPGLAVDFDVGRLFDPDALGVPGAPGELGERNDEYVHGPTPGIRIDEVCLLDSGELSVSIGAGARPGDRLSLVVEIAEHQPATLGLRASTSPRWLTRGPEALVSRLATELAVVHVETLRGDEVLSSNRLFLNNLPQLNAGAERRIQRRVQAALESAEQFTEQLQHLMKDGDDTQLIRFLQWCNISIISRQRPRQGRSPRPAMSESGAPPVNRRRARALALSRHDAAITFIDRHRRRVTLHAQSPTLEGIPTFMHVVRAIVDVCDMQLSKMVLSLKGATRNPDEWKTDREFVASYLVRVEKVLSEVTEVYLPALNKAYGADKAKVELRLDIAPLAERCAKLLAVRDDIEAGQPQVQQEFRPRIPAPYFRNDLLHPGRWSGWSTNVRTSLGQLAKFTGVRLGEATL